MRCSACPAHSPLPFFPRDAIMPPLPAPCLPTVFTALSSLTHLGLRVEPSVLDAALLSEVACLPKLLSLTLEGGVADDILPPLQRLLAGPSSGGGEASGSNGRGRGLARLQLPAMERWGEGVLAVRLLPALLTGLESLTAYRANLQVSCCLLVVLQPGAALHQCGPSPKLQPSQCASPEIIPDFRH